MWNYHSAAKLNGNKNIEYQNIISLSSLLCGVLTSTKELVFYFSYNALQGHHRQVLLGACSWSDVRFCTWRNHDNHYEKLDSSTTPFFLCLLNFFGGKKGENCYNFPISNVGFFWSTDPFFTLSWAKSLLATLISFHSPYCTKDHSLIATFFFYG